VAFVACCDVARLEKLQAAFKREAQADHYHVNLAINSMMTRIKRSCHRVKKEPEYSCHGARVPLKIDLDGENGSDPK
jgi:hypothetical protein